VECSHWKKHTKVFNFFKERDFRLGQQKTTDFAGGLLFLRRKPISFRFFI